MALTRDDQTLLEDATNVLGHPTDIALTGSRGFQAEGSPTGLPSAPAPGPVGPVGEPGAVEGGLEGLPGPVGGEGAAGAAAANLGGAGATGPSNLQKALTGLGLFKGTLGAAQKLQNLPGREANAFNLASTGLEDLGFTLGGEMGQGWIDTALGPLSQQDYAGMLEALRSGAEAPSGAADLLGSQGGYSLFGGGEAAGAAGAEAGTGLAGGIGGAGLAAIPVIMAGLRAAGIDIPQSVSQGVSTGAMTAGALGAGAGVLPASTAVAGPIGLAATGVLMTAMDRIRQGMEPSEDYQSFGGNLAKSLTLENAAANYLGQQLTTPGAITNRQQLADLIGQYKGTLGYGPETFESGTYSHSLGPEYQQYLAGVTDPYALPNLPGATGTSHEWGQTANFDPMQDALNQVVAAYQQYLPEGEVTSGAMTPWTLQALGLNRNPMFYNPFWDQQTGVTEQAGGE